jgi:guanine deaminase
MDLLLSDWLNQYTFPQESRFADPRHAEKVYSLLVKDMVKNGTFHASVFGTIHREASNILFEKMADAGMYGYVGKVNMDQYSPDYLCETTEESLRETERFLHEHQGSEKVKAILTPRFAPTCSEKLMQGLGVLAKRYQCGLQTHLVESRWEAAEALRLYPGYSSDAEIYERAGLMDHGPSIFAHVIFPTQEDIRILQAHNSFSVHCPDATNNVIAGIMPTAALYDQYLTLSLGSDVGGGHHTAVYRQIARAVQLSKLKEFYEPQNNRSITFENAFYMGTKMGGTAFDRVGSLEKGYRFNAIVIDNIEDVGFPMDAAKRLERFCYTGDDRNIIARYIDGKHISI